MVLRSGCEERITVRSSELVKKPCIAEPHNLVTPIKHRVRLGSLVSNPVSWLLAGKLW